MFEQFTTEDFFIISVAMDSDKEAARFWVEEGVEEASPTFITLIDQHHVLSSLYNMVNVPQAVWIDENGRIVRPTETGGSLDILREFDPELGAFKPEATERAQAVKSAYVAAVKDWAENGADSQFLFESDQARLHVPQTTDDEMLAHTKFRLGQYLVADAREQEAEQLFAQARQLHPD